MVENEQSLKKDIYCSVNKKMKRHEFPVIYCPL